MSRRPVLTYANVTATLALVVALSGGAYAATALPRNSVGTAQLKADAVTSAKVAEGSLLAKDFKAGQLPKGPRGAPGADGADGATGPQGPQGPAGSSTPAGDKARGFRATITAPASGVTTTNLLLQNGVQYQLLCGGTNSPFVQIYAGTPNTQQAPYVNANGQRARILSAGDPITTDTVAFNGPSVANPLTLSNGGRYASFTGLVRAETYISQFVDVYAYYDSGKCYVYGFANSISG